MGAQNTKFSKMERVHSTRLSLELWDTLNELKEKDFQTFKWLLNKDGIAEGQTGIPVAQLEKAERQYVVDLMVGKYKPSGALQLTINILGKISRNDLVENLQNFCQQSKDLQTHLAGNEMDNLQKAKTELKRVQQFAVDVTLDPETAHPKLILSDDGKQVRYGNVVNKLPYSSKRFKRYPDVLGKQSFSSGKFYYEVHVKGKTCWDLGIVKESIDRAGEITLSPEDGFWTISLENGDDCTANDDPVFHLSLKSHPQTVGVFVDYDEGLVSFYDVGTEDLLYSFTGCCFTEKLYPYFSPCSNERDINSAPLTICTPNRTFIPSSVLINDEHERKMVEFKRVQQFAVDVTFDPDTAHSNLILSEDRKQVCHGDVRKKLPHSSTRFLTCINVLGEQSISSGRFYFEVQVKGKNAWDLGVVKESIDRDGKITLSPEDGFWTIRLIEDGRFKAIDETAVYLSLKSHPQKVGVFVDYEEGLVSFYDADSADILYSFTDCCFTEKLYPFFCPCHNNSGKNSAPLIITSFSHLTNIKMVHLSDQREDLARKKAELKRVQKFAVDVTLDFDTAHPNLIISEDGKQVYHGNVSKKPPDTHKRFNNCVNVLGKQRFSSGRFYYEVQVKGKTAWTVGVARESINPKGKITLRTEAGFWTIWLRNKHDYEAIDDPSVPLSVKTPLQKVGVFVDYEEGLVSFYDVLTADLLYSFTDCCFTESLVPYLSPCNNDGGKNSAPLIISSFNQTLTRDPASAKEDYEVKRAELKRLQKFAVDVTLDPETAHPDLVLSDDLKQVYDSDVTKELPDSPKRFNKCVEVLGKQGFSSGRFYYEVQVEGKTDWTVGVAHESINRKGKIILNPENGHWAIWLRKKMCEAINDPSVRLSLKSPLKKVGVFVDYEEGLVSFYDVDTADHLYSFTGCQFTEKLYPLFSPCSNNGGKNSAPLIITPVNDSIIHAKHEDYERKKGDLKSMRQFAVEVTLDPDTAHPALILSDDRKQVHCSNMRGKLPYSPKRFDQCVNVLGLQSFFSSKFYYEVQVEGKTEWDLGVVSESINRKGHITMSPENGLWAICLRNDDEYTANDVPPVRLSLVSDLQKVGLFADYEEGLVSFYNADSAELLYSFSGWQFTEKLLPYFSPCPDKNGKNSTPLIISPVNLPPNTERQDSSEHKVEHGRKKAELRSVQQFAVEVTLDPDTAHPDLILSDDGKQVHHDDERKKLPYSPKRFNECVNVLGMQSFSSSKFYYEVQVEGKTEWDLGVVSESINRKGHITMSPENGLWAICLRNDDKYTANDVPPVRLSLTSPLQKVGVFADYEEGLVSFYNAESSDLLYSFTGWCFTEKILPYFSPCPNKNGRNSAPLIICSVVKKFDERQLQMKVKNRRLKSI